MRVGIKQVMTTTMPLLNQKAFILSSVLAFDYKNDIIMFKGLHIFFDIKQRFVFLVIVIMYKPRSVPMEYKYNGKQLHATRLELLIALNYLLDNCPNEHKTSKTIELTKYAEEKFDGAFIDRRKANDIFDDLVEFTHTYPHIIPYTVNRIKNKPRYYVKKNLLNSRDIEKISSAIKDHGSLTEKASNQLIDRFLDKVTDEDKKTKIVQTLKKTPSLVKHQISDENMELIEKFAWLRD